MDGTSYTEPCIQAHLKNKKQKQKQTPHSPKKEMGRIPQILHLTQDRM